MKDNSSVLYMTHNEYQEFLKANASRLYTEKGYTMDDYKRDADRVVVLDFDLDKFGLPDEVKKVINVFFDSESVNKHGHTYLSGRSDHVYALANKLGCECVSDGAYNGFFKNDDSRLIFEFCEGDISLILCETREAYFEEVASYFEFYKVEEQCFVRDSYNLFRDGVYQGKAFSEDTVKDFVLACVRQYPESAVRITQDIKNGYNDSSLDVTQHFLVELEGRLPFAEDDVCIEVYFDGVLMDDVYCPKEQAAAIISSLEQHGYDNYNGDVKEDWERSGGRSNPELSFKVVPYPEKVVDANLDEKIAAAEQKTQGSQGHNTPDTPDHDR